MSDREAWIIDGVRTPRGKGRKNGALHHIHPQELLAQCLNALVGRTGVPTTDIEDVIAGNASGVGDHGADIARLAVLSAGWPFAHAGPDDQPLLRVRPAGRRHGRHRRALRPPGPRHRRRRGVDVAPVHGRLRRHARHDGRRQPARAGQVPADPPGHLGRPHRHRRGLLPDRLRRARRRQPGPRRQGHRRGPLRPQRDPGAQPGRLRGPRPRGVPAPRHDAGGPRPAGPELRRDGRHAVGQVRRRDVRRDVPAHLPADRRRRPRPPRRQLLGRRRRRVGDPRRLVGLRQGQRPARRGPASG